MNAGGRPLAVLLLLSLVPLGCDRRAGEVLVPGGVLIRAEGRIASAETRIHDFEVPGADGGLEVVVEQREVDVEVRLVDPEGRLLAAVDAPTGRDGAEIAVVRTRPGRHRVEVSAPALGAAGDYRLTASWLTEDSPLAQQVLAARLKATEAAARGRATDPGARAEADRLFREALSQLPRRGREGERGRLHHARAVGLRRAGELEEASRELLAAALMWRAAGDRRAEARARNELGLVAWQRGKGDEAVAAYRDALALREEAGDRHGQAQTLGNLGLVHHSWGDPRTARTFYQRALKLAAGTGDPNFEAIQLNSLGGAALDLGEPAEALDLFERALAIHRRAGDVEAQIRALTNTGAASRALGRFEPALDRYLAALELARRSPQGRAEASLLNNLGVVYLALTDFERARSYFERALAGFRNAKDRRGEASALNNLAQSWHGEGALELAREHHHGALARHRELGDRRGEAVALDHLGQVALEQGDLRAAEESLNAALALRREVADPVREARTLRHLAEVRLARGDGAAARQLLDEALALHRRVLDRQGEGETLAVLARTERIEGRIEDALRSIQASLEQLEAFGADLAEPGHRAHYLAALRRAHQDHVGLLMELHRREPEAGWDRRGLEASERGRSRSLLSALGRAEDGPWLPAEVRARREPLVERLGAKASLRTRLLARGEAERAREAGHELDEIVAAIASLDAEARPAHALPSDDGLLDAGAIQGLLEPGTLLLEYALGEERSYLWVVADHRLAVHELPPRTSLEPPARRLHELWSRLDPTDRPRERRLAGALSRHLLGPVAPDLGAARRLVVVADGALNYLPFGALPMPGASASDPLLASHEIVTLPSAAVLAAQRRRSTHRPSPTLTAAVFADPIFEPGDARLGEGMAITGSLEAIPGLGRVAATGREAQVLGVLVRPENLLVALGPAASRARVTAPDVSRARILHFATHGVFDDARPSLSGLMLSRVDESGRAVEGFLGLPEIYGLDLGAELVVLSGCRTALGQEVRGEGLLGLTRGFFHAGADRVLASLWPVQDRATAELIHHFYRAHLVEGEPAAAALAIAQRALARDPRWRDPFYWAVFVLQGDWR